MKKKHLEMVLDNLKAHPNPKVELEQYSTEGNLASELLMFARDDIQDNIIIELGCGTGRFSIGSLLLGAKFAYGVDIDEESTKTANYNLKNMVNILEKFNLKYVLENKNINNVENICIFETMDIKDVSKENILKKLEDLKNNEDINNFELNGNEKIIVIQNPPFGAQTTNKFADRVFLEKALEVADVIYTIHNTPSREFIKKYVSDNNRNITHIFQAYFRIPAIYEFHKKKFVNIPVDIYRIE
ncbi:METTL5 family protein [Methanococcus voltae]|uniref:METTL5 family protein n=1 Tax=Methanococcus voltae TaxID=2188 RepID=UPI00064E8FA2|nr:METTL5 family protein [Methanococcus voltae]